MSIAHAILGMLSCKPLTGYDLKKIMQNTSFMHWSGNNNQIYKALLELQEKGLVTNEVCHQESSPSKKVYTVTDAGMEELKQWSLMRPESFETKQPFLVQLAWADLLSDEELRVLFEQYEKEIEGQLFIAREKSKAGFFVEGRTLREVILWDSINENTIMAYQTELAWIKKTRAALDLRETNS